MTGEHYGEVDKNTVEVKKENITNITEDINEYESPAKKKVETHHEPVEFIQKNMYLFDHVKYDD
jgi:hypothetical protein